MVAPQVFRGNAVRYLLVGTGGALGAMARYALDGLVLRLASPFFPSGTFVVNVVGCLIFGLIIGLADQRSSLTPVGRLFLLIGVLGGFTTFSTYTFETFQLVRHGQYARGLFNAAGQVVAAYIALSVGYIGTRALL
jgi:fluoride exporter